MKILRKMTQLVVIMFFIILGFMTNNIFAADILDFSCRSYDELLNENITNEDNIELDYTAKRLYCSRTMCIHPNAIDRPGGATKYKVIGIIDINKDGKSPNDININNSKNITNNDENNSMMAYICYYAEKLDENNSADIKKWWPSDTLVVFRNIINSSWGTMIRSVNKTIFGYFYTTDGGLDIKTHYYDAASPGKTDLSNNLYAQANKYKDFIKANKDNLDIIGNNSKKGKSSIEESMKDSIETSIENKNTEIYIGPMYYSSPKGEDIDVKVTTGKTVQDYGKVINNENVLIVKGATMVDSNTTVYQKNRGNYIKKDINNLNGNKAFYVKVNNPGEKIYITIKNSYNMYQARMFSFATGSGQENVSLAGKKIVHESYVSYIAENTKPKVSVSKTVYQVNGKSNGVNAENAQVELGDTVTFKIEITNKGSAVNLKLADTIPNGLEVDDICKRYNDSKGWSNSNTMNLNIGAGTETKPKTITKYIKCKVTDQKSFCGKTLTNTAEISDFKISGKTVENEGSPTKDTAKVTIKGFNYKIEKSVNKKEAELGETVTFTIKVSNIGDTNIKNVKVEDILNLEGLTYKSFSGTGWTRSADGKTYEHSSAIKVR